MIKICLIILFILTSLIKTIPTLILLTTLLVVLAFYSSHYLDFFLLNHNFSWDSLSMSLIRLSILIFIIIILSRISNKIILIFEQSFNLLLLILLVILFISFSVNNLIIFYILFESSLIPTFILILGWGNQPERIQAGIYILIYTVFASLPLLVTAIVLSKITGRASFFILQFFRVEYITSYLVSFLLILAFSVKLPLYLVHLWLPKAHVEAPVAGSIILAAILLKLGGYGLIRVSTGISYIYYPINSFILRWSLTGGVIAALICLFQRDVKFLIALSSVSHIAIVIARAISFSSWGINGAQFIIIGHGLCSSGIFYVANIVYERVGSRRLFILKGIQTCSPVLAIAWFLLCTSNISAPPSLNLLGEINSISSLLAWSVNLSPILASLVFLAAAYSLFLYSQLNHGKPTSLIHLFNTPSLREWLILLFHWAPLNLIFLAPWTLQIFI